MDIKIEVCLTDKIYVGGVYAIDKDNTRSADSSFESRVVVLKLHKKCLFRPNIWLCIDVDEYIRNNGQVDESSIILEVPSNLLHPCNTTLIRYDPTSPTFSPIDLKRLDEAINMINRIQNDKNSTNIAASLKALREKINVSVKMREI